MSERYNTNSRNLILDYLKSNSDRIVDVSDIHHALSESGYQINITTIYRFLDKLIADGTVLKFVAENGTRAVYQFVDKERHCQNHLHLQCIKCGAVTHLDCNFMDEISQHVLNEHGFEIQCKNSIIYGLCQNCRTK